MNSQGHLFVKPNQIELNRTVEPADRPRLGMQAMKIYERLKWGPVTTSELSKMAAQYGARIKEIREMLAASGLTVDMVKRDPAGNNLYKIRPFHGSNYERELMARQIKHRKKGTMV
jgi:hypothetical protein